MNTPTEKIPQIRLIRKSYYLSFIALLVFACYLSFFVEYRHRMESVADASVFVSEHLPLFLYAALILFFVLLPVYALLDNLYLTIAAGWGLAVAITFAQMSKSAVQELPLMPEDFAMASDLSSLAAVADQNALWHQYLMIGIPLILAIFFSMLTVFTRREKVRVRRTDRFITFTLSLLILVGGTWPLWHNNGEAAIVSDKLKYFYNTWSPPEAYRYNGFIISFISYMKKVQMIRPAGYSKEKIREITAKYEHIAAQENKSRASLTDEKVNILMIMNESFTDPDTYSDYVKTDQDPIPFTRKLMKSTMSGLIHAPVYGGFTAVTEFEALTGFSTWFQGADLPYHYYVSKQPSFPSIASVVGQGAGYKTTGLHPNMGSFYKRTASYRNMSFDSFIDYPQMSQVKSLKNGYYSTDHSTYKELLSRISDQGKGQLNVLVTIQNHGPYDTLIENHPIKALDADSESQNRYEDYFALIAASDNANRFLINQLSKLREKTILVFWGDHLPGLFKEIPYDAPESWRTPFFIWANFEHKSDDTGIVSPNYIPTLIFDYLNVKKPPFYYLLDTVKESYPILTRKYLENLSQEIVNRNEAVHDYQMIQYDIMSGKKYALSTDLFNLK